MKNFLLVSLAFFGGRLIFRKLLLSKNLEVVPIGLSFNFNPLNPALDLKLEIINPTKGTANLQAINGKVFLLNGTFIATANLNTQTRIAANSRTVINMEIRGINTTLINIITNLINSRNLGIKFDGFITADGVQFPLNFTKKFS